MTYYQRPFANHDYHAMGTKWEKSIVMGISSVSPINTVVVKSTGSNDVMQHNFLSIGPSTWYQK